MAATKIRNRRTRRVHSSSQLLQDSDFAARPQRSELCKRCKRIDVDSILKRKHFTARGKPIRRLSSAKTWSVDSCPLCHLMLQVLPRRTKQSESHELRSLSSNRIMKRGWKAVDTGMLAVDFHMGSKFLVKDSEDSNFVRIIRPKIDFDVVNGWLQYCQDNHSSACSGGDTLPPSMSSRSPSSFIHSFRLIDSETRQIVSGSNQQYVALSYVWAQDEQCSTFSCTLPDQVPDTIQDAITVTRALGLRYLWIDRYCIDQLNPEEVREQVTQMDLIYNCAYLTIIAAAGEGPSHGLPGVGNRVRSSQPYAMIGNHLLVSTLSDPVEAIKRSKWSRRGWTYQEGLLSRRRLIFVNKQIYFECSGMYCCEALNFPLRILHTQNGKHFKAPFCNGVDVGIFPKKIGASPLEIVQRIEDYTRRHLTNQNDILNGILGILRAFEESNRRVLHCAGVPMISAAPKRTRLPFINKPSEWSPVAGFCLGLCWITKSRSRRREGFPSWSWTGWKGEVEWVSEVHEWSIQANEDFRPSIQLQDGRIIDWNNFCQSYNQISQTISGTLHIAAWGTPIQVARNWTSGSSHYEAIIELEEKGPRVWEFRPTCATSLRATTCIGIHLGHSLNQMSRRLYLLVVCEVDKGVYERVGFGEISEKGPLLITSWLPLPTLKKSWYEFRLC